MNKPSIHELYCDLQAYVGWTGEDAARVREVAGYVRERMHLLIDDFYDEIERHPEAAQVITGGTAQVDRLKKSLTDWLSESLECRDDGDYVLRRWKIGKRHAEIGLNPAYTSAALSRVRNGLIAMVTGREQKSSTATCELAISFNKLLDIDLAIIQDAYQVEFTKREKQEEHERSEVKFRMLVETAGCMVVILRPDCSVAYFSPYSEELTSYRAADVADRSFLTTFMPEWARSDLSEVVSGTLAGTSTVAYEAPLVCRDGTQRWIVWNARRLENFEGGPAVLAVGQDLTAWRNAQEQLFRSERLAGIGQMVTGIAHESRNALQRISSSSEMLELQVQENEKALSHVHRVQDAQDDLNRLFEEVRNYAAPIQLERETSSLDAIWQQAWDSLGPARRDRDATLAVNADTVGLTLSVDRFRMLQLFRNLFENALAACSDPLIIEITCLDAEFNHDSALEIRICDNGPGLTPDARRGVFEPFFTTKTKGTGLGMAIARRIVDAHGGEISVNESSHQGAEFVVVLPRFPL